MYKKPDLSVENVEDYKREVVMLVGTLLERKFSIMKMKLFSFVDHEKGLICL